jgi:hypothetical protein
MALVGELATHSPEFRTWWAGHTVKTHTAGNKRILHPVVGELTVAYETLTVGSAPDIRIATYLTDPGTPSADALDLLRGWVATTAPVADRPGSSEPSIRRRNSSTQG